LECESSGQQVHRGDAQLQHHLADMMQSLSYKNDLSFECDQWEETPTLFVTRYEYANIYHTMGDWYNSYQAQQITGILPHD
jgi:glycoprotein 2-beta-D-xylosyltransferase